MSLGQTKVLDYLKFSSNLLLGILINGGGFLMKKEIK
jgi:hypothetical protein